MTASNDQSAGGKAARREALRAAVARLSAAQRAAASAAVCGRVLALPGWRDAVAVLAFSPMPDEPDVASLMPAALADGKLLALPRFNASSGLYEAVPVRDLQMDLVAGRFGIPEPRAGLPVLAVKRLDFILVPGVGFDRRCCRLGRGKGFYDRLLAGLTGFQCGVAFDEQLVDALPVEPHDVRLNCILTPSHVVTR